jgi:hypothetical protein
LKQKVKKLEEEKNVAASIDALKQKLQIFHRVLQMQGKPIICNDKKK